MDDVAAVTDFGDLTAASRADLEDRLAAIGTAVEADSRVPILWHSNAPWVGSGYGAQTALFVPLLEALGYRCAFSAFYGLKGSRLGWVSPDGQQFVVYPGTDMDSHGNDVLGAHTKHWFQGARGIVIALTDPWVLDARIMKRLPLMAWTPIDHDPIIPRTHEWLAKSGALPVAMSRFGERVMEAAGLETVYYVPHGFDRTIFKPADRREVRAALGMPLDAFVVGMVAANLGSPSRKSFSQAFTAFAAFQKTHPDALLYLHTKLENPHGEDLPAMCRTLGIRASSSDQYALALGTPSSVVAALLSSFDVLLNPAMGEGFGIPILEAQACGTPCITTDFSAMPEVAPVEAGNWTVEGQRIWTPFASFQVTPSVEAIIDRLEQAYSDSSEEREARRVSVFKWANQEYRAEDVAERYWRPVLEAANIEFGWRAQQMARY